MDLRVICVFFVLPFLLWGCATGRGPVHDGALPSPELVAPPDKARGYTDSRTLASHSLTSQGYQLLETGDADGALRLLEQAVGINPADGPGYYYLAEAWIAKSNFSQAARFNKLAEIYLRKDRVWALRAKDQKSRIDTKRQE
ncbi:tetratricopeptide repeat protein [Desulfoluna sp.]|uniref:tetratricopeptide repeat protein n=1 Tax=Desulfoluna sp. TaxID=2045199 RepID=UPI00261C0A6D|nr:tetratricopeptide repeat protein [Desulfoluna sp.]